MPQDAEDYIHRIGRTGRAGAEGDAVTFVAGEEKSMVRRIEKYTGKKFRIETYTGFVPPAKEEPSAQPDVQKRPSTHTRPFKKQSHRGSGKKNRRSGTFGRRKKTAQRMSGSAPGAGSWSNY